MGGPGTSSSTSSSFGGLPPWARGAFQNSAGDWTSAEGSLPSISSLYSNTPLLGVPNLNPQQLAEIQQFEQYPTGLNQPEAGAQSTLNFLTDPNSLGYTNATNAAMGEFNQQQLPEIQSQAALQGQGNSGAALAAEALGQSNTLTPLLQQQLQLQSQGVSQGTALGAQQYNQDQQTMTNALQAAGLPYEVAQQQAQALYNQQEQQNQLAQEIQMGPFQQIGSIFGRGNTISTSTPSSGSKF